MHPYPEELLPATMSALGKAFDFADKHLPEGLASFYELFVCSDVARTFDGPDAHPDLNGSGIQLVLSVCEGVSSEGLDLMLMSERRPDKGHRERAKWCGTLLAYHQWDTGATFRAISTYLGIDELFSLFEERGKEPLPQISAHIAQTLAIRTAPTRLHHYRAEAGLTQHGLAAASGVSLRSIQQYEQRKKDINRAQARSVWLLSQALGCSMEDLLEP